MKTAEAARLALSLMKQWNLHDWKFGFNYRKTVLGLCKYAVKRIELSWHLVVLNREAEVRETILHEIAHALAGPKAGHGPVWRAWAVRVGAKPIRCGDGTAAMPVGAWQAICLRCNKRHHMHRRPKRRYKCRCHRLSPWLVWGRAGAQQAAQTKPPPTIPEPQQKVLDLFD